MSEYIDKEQFRETLKSYTKTFNNKYKILKRSKLYAYLFGLGKLLNRCPTADVRENVKGEWLDPYDTGYYECSICGQCSCRDKYDDADLTDFCPNCGADMRGDEE